MNTRRYSRSMAEAFPYGAEYGCAIEKPSRRYRAAGWAMVGAFVYVIGLLVWEAM